MNLIQFSVRSSLKTKFFAKHVPRSFFSITRLNLQRHGMTVQSKYAVCHSDTPTGWNLLPLKVCEIWPMNLLAPSVRRLKFSKLGFLNSLAMCLTLQSQTQKTELIAHSSYQALFRALGSSENHTFSPKRNLLKHSTPIIFILWILIFRPWGSQFNFINWWVHCLSPFLLVNYSITPISFRLNWCFTNGMFQNVIHFEENCPFS